MPLRALAEDEAKEALTKGESDLRWILSDNDVPDIVQAVLYHAGYVKLRMFSGIGESRADVKVALSEDLGLSSAGGIEARQRIALTLVAWEACREYVAKEAALRMESRTARVARPATAIEFQAMRVAFEGSYGKLRDRELP